MQDFSGGPALRPGLVDRVKAILLKPKEEWPRIDLERITIGELYRSYVLILAAIGPVCSAIGALLFGYGAFGVVFRPSIASVLGNAILSYVVSLVMVYVMALIIDALAPTFNGVRGREQAFKVAAYASTASWIGGVFGLIPQLGLLALLAGLYSLYLLYLGLPLLMKVAQDKAIAYVALVVGAAILLFVVLGAITSALALSFVHAGPIVTGSAGGTIAVPGGEIDVAKLAVTDLGAAGALASLGGALHVQSSEQTAQGYEKIGTVDGRMTTEKWSNADRTGSYTVMVANRFTVAAEGEGVPIDALKAAVAAVDPGALERLAR